MSGHRVLIVDNNKEYRSTLARYLQFELDLLIVGEVDIGEEAVRMAARLHPGVIVLDIELPGMDAPAHILALRQSAPAARIVALSLVPDRRYLEECLRAGGDTFLPKDCSIGALVAAIRGDAA